MTNAHSNASNIHSAATEMPAARGRLVFDPASCRTCKVCVMACSIYHEGEARPAVARLAISFDEFEPTNPISARICFQCREAPCLEACPVSAMSRHPVTGAVVIDDDVCIGCLRCRKACPWDVPVRHPDRRLALKCDLCSDRDRGPICVQVCPLSGKALRYEPDYYVQGGIDEPA